MLSSEIKPLVAKKIVIYKPGCHLHQYMPNCERIYPLEKTFVMQA
jgi:hypothetical protein